MESYSEDDGSDEDNTRMEKQCEICGEIVEHEQFKLDGNRYYCSYECLEVDAKESSESGENEVFYCKVSNLANCNFVQIPSKLPNIPRFP